MLNRNLLKSVIITGSLLLLQGCDKNDKMADLKQFMVDAKNSYKTQPIQLPKLDLHDAVYYKSHKMKNPFQASITHKKRVASSPLENFPIEALNLRGVIAKENRYWAAIELPNGQILEVTVGTKIGQQKGVIQSIARGRVKVVERVQDQSGKVTQRTLTLKVHGY